MLTRLHLPGLGLSERARPKAGLGRGAACSRPAAGHPRPFRAAVGLLVAAAKIHNSPLADSTVPRFVVNLRRGTFAG